MGNEEVMARNREFTKKLVEEMQLIDDAARRMDIDGLREQMKKPGRLKLNSHLAELSDEELREYLVNERRRLATQERDEILESLRSRSSSSLSSRSPILREVIRRAI